MAKAFNVAKAHGEGSTGRSPSRSTNKKGVIMKTKKSAQEVQKKKLKAKGAQITEAKYKGLKVQSPKVKELKVQSPKVKELKVQSPKVQGLKFEPSKAKGLKDVKGRKAKGTLGRAKGSKAAGAQTAGHKATGATTAGAQTAGHKATGAPTAGHKAAGHKATGAPTAGHKAAGHKATGAPPAGHKAAGHKDESPKADEQPRKFSKTNFIMVGIILLAIVIGIIIYFILVSGRSECTSHDLKRCERGDATCVISEGESECVCRNPEKTFYDTCKHRCEHDPKTFCTDGVCSVNDCYDIFSYAQRIFSEHCRIDEANVAVCNLTCANIVARVCSFEGAAPRFCKDSIPKTEVDFACQRGTPSGLRELTLQERANCVKDPQCKVLTKIYPCLAGYVQNGTMMCGKRCILPAETNATAMDIFGYCVRREANCEDSMTNLTKILSGNNIGFSYSPEHLSRKSHWVQRTVEHSAELRKLTYPLMLAFGVLAKKGHADFESDSKMSAASFLEFLEKNSTVGSILRALYSKNHTILEKLKKLAAHMGSHRHVSDDLEVRVASLVTRYGCTTFDDCIPVARDRNRVIAYWAVKGSPHCVLSRALFTHGAPQSAWCKAVARMWSDQGLSTSTTSFMYSPSLVTSITRKVSEVNGARELSDGVFKRSFALCSETTQDTSDINNTIIPLPLFDSLGWDPKRPVRPETISSFAIVLASAVSVNRAICNTDEDWSVECELRKYFAFFAFMLQPTEFERKLVKSADKGLIYFTIRAAMRRQQLYGTRMSPFSKKKRETTSTIVIRAAASAVAANCLGQF